MQHRVWTITRFHQTISVQSGNDPQWRQESIRNVQGYEDFNDLNSCGPKITCPRGNKMERYIKRLHTLISHMLHTRDNVQLNIVGDTPENCSIVLYCYAGFAGDLQEPKSTSGGLLCSMGPHTFVTITWLCKKQTEAEIISMETAYEWKDFQHSASGTKYLMYLSQMAQLSRKENSGSKYIILRMRDP